MSIPRCLLSVYYRVSPSDIQVPWVELVPGGVSDESNPRRPVKLRHNRYYRRKRGVSKLGVSRGESSTEVGREKCLF